MTGRKWIGAPNSYVLLQVLVMGYILERLPIEPHYVKLKISFSQNVLTEMECSVAATTTLDRECGKGSLCHQRVHTNQ
jgi:hypothetical protein